MLSMDVWVLFLKLLFLFVELLLEVLKFLLVLVLLFFRNLRFSRGLQWETKKNPSVNSIEAVLKLLVHIHACAHRKDHTHKY